MDENKLKTSISMRFKELRTKHKLSQSKFAVEIGVSASSISSYEACVSLPPVSVLAKISEKYSISIDWLCGLSAQENQDENIRTYSDIIKLLAKIDKANIQNLEVNYTDDAFELINGIRHEIDPFGTLYFHDYFLSEFFKQWKDIKKLRDNGTIDDQLYDPWIAQKLKEYNFEIANKETQRIERDLNEQGFASNGEIEEDIPF